MSPKQHVFLLSVCEVLDVSATYFVDSSTAYLKPGFRLLCELRMQEIGIYSFIDLGRLLGLTEPRVVLNKVMVLDAQAAKENCKLRGATNKED